MNKDIIAYYRDRAKEYDKVYEKPERQSDIAEMALILKEKFTGKDILEIACGTGYWTEQFATTAAKILATDINESVIEVAKSRNYPKGNVQFAIADIYKHEFTQRYPSLFGGFLWSHILVQDMEGFISRVNNWVEPGGLVVFADNHMVDDSNHPIAERDEQGNTYQHRKLADGTEHRVLKNFPTDEEILKLLKGKAVNISIERLKYYWVLSYNTLTR